MILVDTNIIIRFWRSPDEKTADVFRNEDVAVCGTVKAELLHGARSEEDYRRIVSALADFPCIEMRETDWDLLGYYLYLLRTGGVTIPFQDALIATLALSNEASVWTNDKHFTLIQSVLPKLQLYEI